jgi:hypothetical protein
MKDTNDEAFCIAIKNLSKRIEALERGERVIVDRVQSLEILTQLLADRLEGAINRINLMDSATIKELERQRNEHKETS